MSEFKRYVHANYHIIIMGKLFKKEKLYKKLDSVEIVNSRLPQEYKQTAMFIYKSGTCFHMFHGNNQLHFKSDTLSL